MSTGVPSPVPVTDDMRVYPGSALLAGIGDGPSLFAHRERYGELPALGLPALQALVSSVGLRGRGGAAFPFARKLETAAKRRRPVVVVNLSEGEPASCKDSALATTRAHLVLDGAIATATALRAREVHLVLPGDRPRAAAAVRAALAEREDRVTVHEHEASARFVAGQAQAVIELLSGRENLPVTTWTPAAAEGLRGRPTLLSNAETWAQVGRLVLRGADDYCRRGTADEPGTVLMTFSTPGAVPQVREVEYGARLVDVLPASAHGRPAIVGGFHGAWATWSTLAGMRVSVPAMAALGVPLGAGVVHTPRPGACPLDVTSRIVDYLAGQSAGRCGPCFNGLPALAGAVQALLYGTGGTGRVDELGGLVVRRGACAHPDGTVRLVRSLFAAMPEEINAHRAGGCAAPMEEAAS